MSEHIHLSVSRYKSKSCKIARKWKEKSNNCNSVILQRKVKQSMTNVCMVHFTWKENDYQKKREINEMKWKLIPSFFIESVYLFLYSLSFFKDIVLLGKLNCQSVPVHRPRMLDTTQCTLSCGSLHSSVRYRPRLEECHQAGCAHLRPSLVGPTEL